MGLSDNNRRKSKLANTQMRIEARETIKQREIRGIEKESESGVGVSEAREENKIKKKR